MEKTIDKKPYPFWNTNRIVSKKIPLYFAYFMPSKISELKGKDFIKEEETRNELFKSHWLKYANKSREQVVEETYG